MDQLQKKVIDIVPGGDVVTRVEHARTQALVKDAQLKLQELQNKQKQAERSRPPIQQAIYTREGI